MKQTDLDLSIRRTRKQVLLDEVNQVMPWADLLALIATHAPVAKTIGSGSDAAHSLPAAMVLPLGPGRRRSLVRDTLLPRLCRHPRNQRIPDRVSILRFRHLLEEHALSPKILQVINAQLAAHGLLLKTGTVVDADSGLLHTVIGAVVSTGGTYSLMSGFQAEFWK